MARLLILLIPSLIFFSCNSSNQEEKPEANGTRLLEVKKLDHYPSASGIEYVDSLFYVIGDDARYLLILDHNLDPIDSIQILPGTEYRLPKETKPDLESVLFTDSDTRELLLISSGSLQPFRDTSRSFELANKKARPFLTGDYFSFLKIDKKLQEINIEGSMSFADNIILANRGNKSWPHNQLIFNGCILCTDDQQTVVTEVLQDGDTASFKGVSGLDLAAKHDYFLLTLSTEDTKSSFDDGTIGASYLGIIKNVTVRELSATTRIDSLINLDSLDSRFKGQKIESVCVVRENFDEIELVLCADNDDGSSTLFRMILRIK